MHFLSINTTYALNTGFTIDELPENIKNDFMYGQKFYRIEVEPEKHPIDCFDVSDTECIAIGAHSPTDSNKKTVCIYTKEGKFKYGIGFECSGFFGIEWDDENLVIYFLRSNVAVSMNIDALPLEAVKIIDTYNYAYWENTVKATTRTVDGTKYELRNTFDPLGIASSYSRLVVVEDGTDSVIYDVTSSYSVYYIVTIILIIVIVLSFFIRTKNKP